MSITQHHPEVLNRFLDAVEVGTIYGPYERNNGATCWAYGASGEKAECVLETLWPYLSRVKREQAQRVRLRCLEELEQRSQDA